MKSVCVVLLMLFATTAFGGSAKGVINDLRASNKANTVIFGMTGDIDEAGSCNKWEMFGISLQTEGGKAVFELVKFAYLNQLEIEVFGLGTCKAHWRSEDVKDVHLKRAAT